MPRSSGLPQKLDKAEILSARLLLMKRLPYYKISLAEIASVLGVDVSTLSRWSDTRRLKRRSQIEAIKPGPFKPLPRDAIDKILDEHHPDDFSHVDDRYIPPHDPRLAPRIAIILLIREGYSVPVIMRVLRKSQASVYRDKNFLAQMDEGSPEEIEWIRRDLNQLTNYDPLAWLTPRI
jgi:hypothetical protein